MSLGTIINRVLDKVLPDIVGDMVGTFADAVGCNPMGVAANAADAIEDVLESCGKDEAARAAGTLAGMMGGMSGTPEGLGGLEWLGRL
jgi:hypothetical protein